MSGVFPKPGERVTSGPLGLVYCPDSGLLQLRQSYDLGEMYGDNYGYRSGLNQSMVKHLTNMAKDLQSLDNLDDNPAVLDIGGNDGTLLKAFDSRFKRVCIDPTANKWIQYYKHTDIVVIPDFFPEGMKRSERVSHAPLRCGGDEFDIITSISCFYDLEDPNAFVAGIKEYLKPNGIWLFEQSHLPAMISANSYDTICHEHLEYYTLKVVEDLLARHGLKVVNAGLNSVNGGSFYVMAMHEDTTFKIPSTCQGNIQRVREAEAFYNKNPLGVLKEFESRAQWHRRKLTKLIDDLNQKGHSVAALGASTKGNILLQYCDLTRDDIAFVSDVNPNKHGCVTPGTKIPIVSEKDSKLMKPDYMLVLPWHFKRGIIEREHEYLNAGGRLIFPLPDIQIVGQEALP